MFTNGCHNRADYKPSYLAQDGYYDSGAWRYTERPYLILRLDTLEAAHA